MIHLYVAVDPSPALMASTPPYFNRGLILEHRGYEGGDTRSMRPTVPTEVAAPSGYLAVTAGVTVLADTPRHVPGGVKGGPHRKGGRVVGEGEWLGGRGVVEAGWYGGSCTRLSPRHITTAAGVED